MQHHQVSPRVKTHSHFTFSAGTAANDIFFNDYSLEPRKPTPKKAAQDVAKDLGRQNQSIPVLKGFHKVVKTEEASPGYLFNSERGKQLIQMNVVNKPEVITPKPVKVMKFIRHPHKSHSTKIVPRVEEEPANENKMKSLSEIMMKLEAKENEIKQLQQTNQKMKKEIATLNSKNPEAKKVQEKLEKCEKIIHIYSKILNSCSSVPSYPDYQIIDTAVQQESELSKPERRKIVQKKNKRGSLEVYVKDASELYYNEAGSTGNITKAKVVTAPDLNCNLQTKTSLYLNCEALEEKSANFQVELKTPTSVSGFYSARESTSKPGKIKRNFVLRRCESKSKIKFNLTTVSSDTCDEIKTDRGGQNEKLLTTPLELKKRSMVESDEQQLKRKNSSMENTRDTIKNEKNSFNCQELNGVGEKLARIMTMYQLEEEKMMKKTAEIIKKLESLKSKPVF